MALSTARMHKVRGRPPLLAAGISSWILAHSSSVRSLGYVCSFIFPFYKTHEDFSDRLLEESVPLFAPLLSLALPENRYPPPQFVPTTAKTENTRNHCRYLLRTSRATPGLVHRRGFTLDGPNHPGVAESGARSDTHSLSFALTDLSSYLPTELDSQVLFD